MLELQNVSCGYGAFNAVSELSVMVRAGTRQKPRVATKPSRAAKAKRVDEKKQRAGVKSLRRKPADD